MLRQIMLAFVSLGLAACGGGAPATTTTVVVADAPADLVIGGDTANFGAHVLTTGFLPDPATYRVVSGGDLDAASAGTAPGCNGWVTRQPDLIVSFEQMSGFLRFAFRADTPGEDATLVINDGMGNWHCNDDGAGTGLNPMVDLADAPPGQYDIWVGSYQSGANVTGELMVTELTNVTP